MDGPLEIRTLGSPEILLDGQPVHLNTKRPEALLIYLACEGHSHPRSELAEKFWGDSEPEQSRANLRVALKDLRDNQLSPFVSTDDPVSMRSSSNYWIDAQEFETQVKALISSLKVQTVRQLEQVLALYCGEFHKDFFIERNDFEAWVREKRRAYRSFMQMAPNDL